MSGITDVTVNGEPLALDGFTPHTTALDFLRDHGLTGAKEGCAEGECGACCVLVARPPADGSPGTEWTSVNACLVSAVALAGQEVVTAEGLGTPADLHPVQRELAERGGSQCGYCTPGFACSMAAEFYRADRTSSASTNGTRAADGGENGFDLHALSGNLCRCTGYRPIRDAAYALGEPAASDPLAVRRSAPAPHPCRPGSTAEARVRPPARPGRSAGVLHDGDAGRRRGHRPRCRDQPPRLAAAAGRRSTGWTSCATSVGRDERGIGAALSLTEIERRLAGRVPVLDEMFPQFASRLIRNGATLGGNLGTGSPIGDSPPALLALSADRPGLARGERRCRWPTTSPATAQSVRRPGELIRRSSSRCRSPVGVPQDRQAPVRRHLQRRPRVRDRRGDGVVRGARIGLGGVAATPIRALDDRGRARGPAMVPGDCRRGRKCWPPRAPRSTTSGPRAPFRSAMLGQSCEAPRPDDRGSARHERPLASVPTAPWSARRSRTRVANSGSSISAAIDIRASFKIGLRSKAMRTSPRSRSISARSRKMPCLTASSGIFSPRPSRKPRSMPATYASASITSPPQR